MPDDTTDPIDPHKIADELIDMAREMLALQPDATPPGASLFRSLLPIEGEDFSDWQERIRDQARAAAAKKRAAEREANRARRERRKVRAAQRGKKPAE